MKAVLLAGGLGTRLRPLTDHLPKCMVPIDDRPLLGHWIDLLLRNGVEEILINTHHLPGVVRDFVAHHHARDRIALMHEERLLGTAGTLRAMAPHLGIESVFVAHADNLADFSFSQFKAMHSARAEGIHLTLLAFQTDKPRACGILELDSNGMVSGFYEKVAHPPGTLANGAVYWMDSAVLRFIADNGSQPNDLSTQVLPHFIGQMQAWYDPKTYLRDIGSAQSLRQAQEEWRDRAHALQEALG